MAENISNIYEEDAKINKSDSLMYRRWRKEHLPEKKEYEKKSYEPLISVVIPVYNVEDRHLTECIESIVNQTYPKWELHLIDDNSSWDCVRETLGRYEDNPKINIIYRKENGHISKATNDGINAAKGEFIAFMDCDDVIEEVTLAEMVYYLNEHPDTDFVYSDEDKVDDESFDYHNPFFKPDWSPDTFLSMMYTNHLAIYRRKIVCEVGGLRTEYNGSQDYDLTLRFMEKSDNKRVGHVPKVLYHWRERPESAASSVDAKPYAITAAGNAKKDAIRRRNLDAELEFIPDLYQYRINYHTTGDPKVSIVIPSKDNPGVLMQCIDSLTGITSYKNYEIIVVDNGSSDYNKEIIESFLDMKGAKYIYKEMEFNFSKMCNIGASASTGEYLLFLNDDIEIIENIWLERMLGQAMQPYTGAVGAKLLYPTNAIQHVGLSNLSVGPSHMFIGYPDSITVNFCRNRLTFNWIAVTGACLLVSKEKFDKVGGFDEELTVSYNDVDLCIKLYDAGYYNVSRMDAKLYHHESMSRGYDIASRKKMDRLYKERMHLYRKHERLLRRDPFYNVNLAPDRIDYEMDMYGIGIDNSAVKLASKDYPVKPSSMNLGIDGISKDETVKITGWAFTDNSENDLKAVRYVMLKNKAGQIFLVPTDKLEREDLSETFSIDNLTEGFTCVVDRKLLATNMYSYDIGLLQVNPDGSEVYVWSAENVPHDGIEDVDYKYYSYEAPFDSSLITENVMSSIDSAIYNRNKVTRFSAFSGLTTLRGWAYMPGSVSSDVRIEIGVVSSDKPDTMTVYDTLREPRFDVASSLPGDNCYLSGFRCEIPYELDDSCKVYIVLTDMRDGTKHIKH